MRKSILRKILMATATVCSVAAVALIGANATPAPVKVDAETVADGENLFSMDFSTKVDGNAAGTIYWGNRTWVGCAIGDSLFYFDQSEGWDDTHGQTYKLVSRGNSGHTSPAGMNFNIAWKAGKTYLISYWVKTSATMTNFILSPRAVLNGVEMPFDGDDFFASSTSTDPTAHAGAFANKTPRPFNYKLTTAVAEWTKYTFSFTPSADATSGTNVFGFQVKIPTLGDTLELADIQVKEVNNLFKKETATVVGNSEYYTKEEQTNGATRFTMTKARDDNAKSLEYKHDIAWEANATYNITYTVVVNNKDDATLPAIRFSGLAGVNGTETTLQNLAANGKVLYALLPGHKGRLYTLSYDFTPTADATGNNNYVTFRLWNAFNAGDYFELQGVSVVKVNETTHEKPKNIVKDNLTVEGEGATFNTVRESFYAPTLSNRVVPFDESLLASGDVYRLTGSAGVDYTVKAPVDLIQGVSYHVSYWVYGGNAIGSDYNVDYSNDKDYTTSQKPWILTSVNGSTAYKNALRGWMTTNFPMAWTKVEFAFSVSEVIDDGSIDITFTNTQADSEYYIAGLTVTPDMREVKTVGASVRLSATASGSGIRFMTIFDEATISAYEEEGYTVTLGTLIKGGTYGSLSVNTAGVRDIVNGDKLQHSNSYSRTICAYLYGFDESKYADDMTAVGYIKLEKAGEEVKYIYSSAIQRSLKTVAQAALDGDTNPSGYTTEQLAILNAYAGQ